jgi:hypothetical protein
MFNGLYFIKFCKKITASIHDGLNPLAESPAGLRHGSLGRLAITSLILVTREATLLWGALLMSRSQTLHT